MSEWVNDHLVQISYLEDEDTQAQRGRNLLQASDRTETKIKGLTTLNPDLFLWGCLSF